MALAENEDAALSRIDLLTREIGKDPMLLEVEKEELVREGARKREELITRLKMELEDFEKNAKAQSP
jgi:hypothetical protein